MTPAARVAAAIDILDEILSGTPAEKTLTTWARRNRYAGSGDRAAVRDHVFGALRCKRSFGWLGGAQNGHETGRALMIGAIGDAGGDPAEIFTGATYAPAELVAEEVPSTILSDAPLAVQLDMPDWLIPELEQSLGEKMSPVAQALRERAPVFLRVNLIKTDRETAQAALASEGIATRPHSLSPTALEVIENPRRVANSQIFKDGLVELQDVASQAVVDALPKGARVLDYCAGGGGKSLALAARDGTQVFAHDIDPARMQDIPERANRAGAQISQVATEDLVQTGYDLVFCDAPCSGSGSWRRAPDAKWRLTSERLEELRVMQAEILRKASALVAAGGALSYATCSLFQMENAAQITDFLTENPGWSKVSEHSFTPLDGGDGFYVVSLRRA